MSNITKFHENSINNVNDDLDFNVLISKLKEKEQIALTLYYKYGCNTVDIGKILNENPSTIKSRINRAEGKLKEMLKEGEKNESNV